MPRKKGHSAGNKINKKHTTHTEAAEPVVTFLQRSRLVRKIALSIIKQARTATKRIVLSRINGGLRLMVYGSASCQEILAYSKSVSRLEKEIAGDPVLSEKFRIRKRHP